MPSVGPRHDLTDAFRADTALLLAAITTRAAYIAVPELTDRVHGLPDNWAGRVAPDFDLAVEAKAVVAPEIAGFGIFVIEGRPRSAIVSYRRELRGRTASIEAEPAILHAIGASRNDLATDPVVLGLPPPAANAGCGSSLWAGQQGSAGPLVQRTGTTGVLTAGHVATAVGFMAYLDGSEWGPVEFTTHGTTNPADVAFVARADPQRSPPRCPQPSRLARPGLGIEVASYGALTCKSGNVMGILPFQWFPALGRNLGEILLTAQPIAVPGDSGGLVTEVPTGAMVGLVVGSDREARVYTSIQLAEFGLLAAGCTL